MACAGRPVATCSPPLAYWGSTSSPVTPVRPDSSSAAARQIRLVADDEMEYSLRVPSWRQMTPEWGLRLDDGSNQADVVVVVRGSHRSLATWRRATPTHLTHSLNNEVSAGGTPHGYHGKSSVVWGRVSRSSPAQPARSGPRTLSRVRISTAGIHWRRPRGGTSLATGRLLCRISISSPASTRRRTSAVWLRRSRDGITDVGAMLRA
jgi:hypothetical protein